MRTDLVIQCFSNEDLEEWDVATDIPRVPYFQGEIDLPICAIHEETFSDGNRLADILRGIFVRERNVDAGEVLMTSYDADDDGCEFTEEQMKEALNLLNAANPGDGSDISRRISAHTQHLQDIMELVDWENERVFASLY